MSLTCALPVLPEKRYFTISEASQLCNVKPHVLRYWEQEFPQLRPHKRMGNRRYYQRKDLELVCQIRDLLYSQGFTIQGARQRLQEKPAVVSTVAAAPAELSKIKESLNNAIKEIDHLLQVLEV